ncbi:hypothetical protein [Spirillospora sp. CA-128828]|uniref:hypothetical protein n=1 Tax=Spirillospora sp. CA-128828 TaxID=3240033 RepID=UPI003D8E059F
MRLTDRVEQVVIAAIEGHAALAGCEVDHQVQVIHQQTRGGAPAPMLWISLSAQSLVLGEWLFHDPIITADLHPDPQQLTKVVRQALVNLTAARAGQAKTLTPVFRDAGQMFEPIAPTAARLPAPAQHPLMAGH